MSNLKKIDSEISTVVGFLHKGGEIKSFQEDIGLITAYLAGLYYIDDIDEIFPKLKKRRQVRII